MRTFTTAFLLLIISSVGFTQKFYNGAGRQKAGQRTHVKQRRFAAAQLSCQYVIDGNKT
jgi:hypothetical protein